MQRYYIRKVQRGAAMVEAAIMILVFLMVIFGIMEFSMFIHKVSSLAEATRAGARHLVVNGPVISLPDCENNFVSGPESCGGNNDCNEVFDVMAAQFTNLQQEHIYVKYSCSTSGYVDAPSRIYEVEVSVKGAEWSFFTPGILGFAPEFFTVSLPEFETTRLSEDLETVGP